MSARLTAILLAGGQSSRMGQAKGLLDYFGAYWIEEQVKRLKNCGIRKILVGIGYEHEKYQLVLSDWVKRVYAEGIDVQLIRNHKPEKGPFSTLQTCLKQVTKGDIVLLQPIDCPLSTSSGLLEMVRTAKSAVACYKGRKGHPVLLEFPIWGSFLDLGLDDPAARLDVQIKQREDFFRYPEIDDPQVRMNLNRPSDWSDYLEQQEKEYRSE